MTDFLLELRSEEIPARMQEKAAADLVRLFAAEIAKAGLVASGIESFVTPRRLALIARDLPLATEAVAQELKGPRADAPAQAIAGFLGKTGLTREQLVERTDAKGNAILFAVIEAPGRATADVLAEAVPAIVRAFPWPKAMRWGAASLSTESPRWVRPLQGIVALLGEAVVPFEIAGVTAGAATLGHRFHHPGIITIGSAADYAEKLRACHVIVDAEERRAIVRAGATQAAEVAGFVLVADEGLVAENAGLTEWPVPLLGTFDPAFLDVPREVIQLTLRTNQKYFVCAQGDGTLAPAFVCTANIEASDGGAKIVEGNGKVLAARLADARFFWEQDVVVPLDVRAEKLSDIVFHEKLGTVADKVERVAKLARWLVEEGIVKPSVPFVPSEVEGRAANATPGSRVSTALDTNGDVAALANLAERAARLAKADLVTGMVGEFPELQGVMGGYYAAAQGEDPQVAAAIRDHYKPVGQGDEVPTAPVTVAVSLADKLDTICRFFSIGVPPTGSKDPFALRRAALGAIKLIFANELRVSLFMFSFRALLIDQPWSVLINLDRKRKSDAFFGLLDEFGAPATIEAFKALIPTLLEDVKQNDVRMLEAIGGAALNAAPYAACVRDFFLDRLEVSEREFGARLDVIRAAQVIEYENGREDDLVRLLARVKALQAFVETEDGANLLAGYRRAGNILKAEAKKDAASTRHPGPVPGSTDPQAPPPEAGRTPAQGRGDDGRERRAFVFPYDPDPAEAALAHALDTQLPIAADAIAQEQFEQAMTALSVIRPAIDRFFDDVTVNSQDETQRATRLALLERLVAAMHNVADFSKIEG